MTVVGEAIVLVRPISTGFAEKVLADTDRAMTQAGQKAGASFGKSITSAIPGTNALQKGIVGVVATTVALGVASIDMANKFNRNLVLLQTQAGASASEVANVKKEVLALAPAVATGPAALAEAMYHIESVGYRGATALDVLTVSAKEAKISQANLDDTTYALTSTLTTGIKGITGAASAMAALNAIVGTGDMHFQDLNGAISTGFLATAETFGVSLQSIGAALAYMTDRGSGAQESATRLRMSLALMAAPSNQASKMLTAIGLGGAEVEARTGAMTTALQAAHLTTTTLADDLKKPDGLEVALSDLVTHLRDSGLSADASSALISRAFGGGRSGAAIMSMVQHLDVLQQKFDKQGQIAKNWGADWDTTTQTTSFKWSQFVTLVQTDAIKVGEALMPMVTTLGSGLFHALSGAPALLRPVGQGFSDVGHAVGEVVTALLPVGKVLVTALGGAVFAAIQGTGFLLRDVVAPGVHLVADGLHLLTGTTPGVILLTTVLAYELLPVVTQLVTEFAAWSFEKLVVGFANATIAAEGLGGALEAMNLPLLAVGLAIGGAVALYESYAHAKDKATQSTNALVTALDKENSGVKDSVFTEIGKQLNDANVDDNIRRLGLSMRTVEEAVNGSTGAWDSYEKQTMALTDSSKVGSKQAQQNAKDVDTLTIAMLGLSGTVGKANSKYADMVQNQHVASKAIADAKAPTDSLAGSQAALAAANTTLDQATGGLASSADSYSTELQKQFPIFDAYTSKLNLNGTALLNNIEGTVKAIEEEQKNVTSLIAKGLDPATIKTLVDKGPEYVAAAAQLTTTQLTRLQGDVSNYMTGIGTLSITAAMHDGSKTGQAFTNALTGQQKAAKNAAMATFYTTVAAATKQAEQIAGVTGTSTAQSFGARADAARGTVLEHMLNALPGPVRAATLSALGIATDAGGKLPRNFAEQIDMNAPTATAATARMISAVQSRIDILHGKEVQVKADDLASGALDKVNSDITTLEGLNNTLKAMRFADGGFVPGWGAARGDDRVVRVSSQEHVTAVPSAAANRDVLGWMDSNPGKRIPGYADGGGIDVWPVLLSGYLQSLAKGIDPSKLNPPAGTTGSVASWAPTILTALRMTGAPLSWLPLEEKIMGFESGGSTTVINPIADAAGHAIGLMQMKLGTFMAHALPGMTDIYNGLDQLVSSIRYQIADWGGPANIPGVISGSYGGYDAGGPVGPGRTLVINNTGGDEWIENGPQHQARMQNGRPVPNVKQENHFYGVDLDEALTEAGSRLMHTLTTTMR